MPGHNGSLAYATDTVVSVVGLGYIGLPTAAMFAEKGVTVVGVDINVRTVELITQGRVHIAEPGLEDMVRSAVTSGGLRATLHPESADAFLLAVPTPFKGDHEPDLAYVEAAARSIAPVLQKGNLVVLESTSPVGSTEQVAAWMAAERPDLTFPQQAGEDSDIRVAHCPERILPGRALQELVENDRIIGGMTPFCARKAAELYGIFVVGECCITNARTAEMCKLTENASRDVNIAFANELSMICDKLGIDVWELIRLANRHPRVNILQPGPGVGGHCIAVDPWFIVDGAPEEAQLIRKACEVNDLKTQWVIGKIKAAVVDALADAPDRRMADITVACLGLAFKADIDDLRESPAVSITRSVAALGCQIFAVEPHIDALPDLLRLPNVHLKPFEEALEQAHVFCLLVGHMAFARSVPELMKRHGRIVDTVGLLARNSSRSPICAGNHEQTRD